MEIVMTQYSWVYLTQRIKSTLCQVVITVAQFYMKLK